MEPKDPRRVLSGSHAQSHPPCFDSASQYRQWLYLETQSAGPRDRNVCLDCTPEYKDQMLKENRCTHPETRFVIWANKYKEIEVIGVCNRSPMWKRVTEGTAILNWREEDGED